jgi:hypothetical protein
LTPLASVIEVTRPESSYVFVVRPLSGSSTVVCRPRTSYPYVQVLPAASVTCSRRFLRLYLYVVAS